VKLLFPSIVGLPSLLSMILLTGASPCAAQVCAARVKVHQVGMKANQDGTRTLRYQARVQTDSAGPACATVAFSVLGSYVKPGGATLEDTIPVAVDARRRTVVVEGEEVLPTSKLVYWRVDGVTCEPCPETARAQKGAPRAASTASRVGRGAVASAAAETSPPPTPPARP